MSWRGLADCMSAPRSAPRLPYQGLPPRLQRRRHHEDACGPVQHGAFRTEVEGPGSSSRLQGSDGSPSAQVQVYLRKGDLVFSCYRFDSRAVLTLYSHSKERRTSVPTFVTRNGSLFGERLRGARGHRTAEPASSLRSTVIICEPTLHHGDVDSAVVDRAHIDRRVAGTSKRLASTGVRTVLAPVNSPCPVKWL